MLGLPKRLGLNGENLLCYNELEERKGGGGGGEEGVGWGVFDTGGWGELVGRIEGCRDELFFLVFRKSKFQFS